MTSLYLLQDKSSLNFLYRQFATGNICNIMWMDKCFTLPGKQLKVLSYMFN